MVSHWISHNQKQVKQWVQNRVVEILKFTEPSERMFGSNQDIIVELGTQRVNDFNWLALQNETFCSTMIKTVIQKQVWGRWIHSS